MFSFLLLFADIQKTNHLLLKKYITRKVFFFLSLVFVIFKKCIYTFFTKRKKRMWSILLLYKLNTQTNDTSLIAERYILYYIYICIIITQNESMVSSSSIIIEKIATHTIVINVYKWEF